MIPDFNGSYFRMNQQPLVEKSFLALPSFLAGVCLGLNNFLLGLISDEGLSSAYIFSFGALVFGIIYRVNDMLQTKVKYGKLWRLESSNLFIRNEDGNIKLNKSNAFGLILRTSINMCFQATTMLALQYAKKSGLN